MHCIDVCMFFWCVLIVFACSADFQFLVSCMCLRFTCSSYSDFFVCVYLLEITCSGYCIYVDFMFWRFVFPGIHVQSMCMFLNICISVDHAFIQVFLNIWRFYICVRDQICILMIVVCSYELYVLDICMFHSDLDVGDLYDIDICIGLICVC